MNRCKTCRHWAPEDPDKNGALIGAGQCVNAPQIYDVADKFNHDEHEWQNFYRLRPEHMHSLAVVQGEATHGGRLLTTEDFGCVMHECTSYTSPASA